MNVLKQWRCENSHLLGLVVRNGSGVPQLMVYRHAIDAQAEQPAEVDVMIGPVTGLLPVRCDICMDVAVWEPSVDAMLHLFDRLKGEQARRLQLKLSGRRVRRKVNRNL
jgi:hypothetical protein